MSSPASSLVRIVSHIFAVLAMFISPTMASSDTTASSSPFPTASDGMPTPSDNAQDGNQGSAHTSSLVNYYFVFLALIVCIAGLGAYFMYKRKKKYGAIIRQSRQGALERDLNTWDPIRARRRYWQGRWRSADQSREEGLNEFGEAPPPYVPKSGDDEAGPHQVPRDAANGPALPMQALSREQAGLKPPDYTETHVYQIHREDVIPEIVVSSDTQSAQPTQTTQVSDPVRPQSTQQSQTLDTATSQQPSHHTSSRTHAIS